MSYLDEYLTQGATPDILIPELMGLIAKYNDKANTYMFVYSADLHKPFEVPNALQQSDLYVIRDFLRNKGQGGSIDFYIETPGGSGETAEDICDYLHDNFEKVSFVISGEAKSAGTLLALSGHEILMTETGSLGPIDAQLRIGRSVQSAYDYMEWVDAKREEAEKTGILNPFDAMMIAQISPGELGNAYHSLRFAEDLVIEWLPKYKFKDWTETETSKEPVSQERKAVRAKEIAKELTNHSKWRSHGRSLKVRDLEEIGLKIGKLDENAELAEIVYRIQTVCRLIFDSSTTYKIFATADNKLFKQALPAGAGPVEVGPVQIAGGIPDVVRIDIDCGKCGRKHKIYAKLVDNPQIDIDQQREGYEEFPANAKITCECGFEIDLLGIKNDIEMKTQKRIIFSSTEEEQDNDED